jgi:hypothetical protein
MAAQTYYCTLTAVGEAKDANAKALGIALKFTEMALGDGNGALPIPDRTRTALVRQVRRGAINSMKTDPANPGQVIIEQVIPETEGGWWIRELGVYDSDGDLVAIGNCPETYKPQLAEGSGRTQVVRMVLIMSSSATVQLKVDPSVVLATRKYVDDQDALHVAALDPHPQYLTKTDGAARIAAAVAALVNASPSTLDTLAELATALGNDQDFAAHMMAALALKAPLASPVLTGTPSAPTPGQFDHDDSIATTGFVQRAIGNLSGIATPTASTVLTLAQLGSLVLFNGSTPNQILRLPAVAGVLQGHGYWLQNTASVPVTIAANAAETISSNGVGIGSTSGASLSLGVGESTLLVSTGGGWTEQQGLRSSSIGFLGSASQSWKDVSASRTYGVVYTNTTGRPILVVASGTANNAEGYYTLQVGGVVVGQAVVPPGGKVFSMYTVVPAGSTYVLNKGGGDTYGTPLWAELR